MTSFTRFALAGLATLTLVGSAEAMPAVPQAASSVASQPLIEKAAIVIVRRPVRRRVIVKRVIRRPPVVIKKIIR